MVMKKQGKKEKRGTPTALKEVWYDAEMVNKRETTLRRDALDVEKAALVEKSTATSEKPRDSESLENSDTENFSQSETIGFAEEALKQTDVAKTRLRTRARNVKQFVGEVRTHLAETEGNHVKSITVYEEIKMTIGTGQ